MQTEPAQQDADFETEVVSLLKSNFLKYLT